MLVIDNPPSNDYLDYTLIHSFQKAGFSASNHTGPRESSKFSGSIKQQAFDGYIEGKQFIAGTFGQNAAKSKVKNKELLKFSIPAIICFIFSILSLYYSYIYGYYTYINGSYKYHYESQNLIIAIVFFIIGILLLLLFVVKKKKGSVVSAMSYKVNKTYAYKSESDKKIILYIINLIVIGLILFIAGITIQNLIFLVVGISIVIVGLIIFSLKKKQVCYIKATIVYWGINEYELKDDISMNNLILDKTNENGHKSDLQFASLFHPARTHIHISIAFTVDNKDYPSYIEQLFDKLREFIGESIGLKGVPYNYELISSEIDAKTLLDLTPDGKIKNLGSRFPL